jgi:hypothetical protein
LNTAAASRTDHFGADLRQALRVWARQPLLPIISVVYWTVPVTGNSTDVTSVLILVVFFVFLGWPGTEREWYRRAFANEVFPLSAIWPTSRRFFGPFLRLGLLLLPVGFPLLIVYGIWYESSPVLAYGAFLLVIFIFDVALTFVTPALTFTTSSAANAIYIGLSMLRACWPAAAPYALTPALFIILGTQIVLEPLIGPVGALIAQALAGLLALAIKGATVAFYLRHPPAPST